MRRDPETVEKSLENPCNLIYAAKRALGLRVTSEWRIYPMPRGAWPGIMDPNNGYWQHSAEDKYPSGLSREEVLPDGRKVRLLPSTSAGTRGGRGHRIQIKCALCDHWIPIGRMHQHLGQKACRTLARRPTSQRHSSG